jgi:hypothetical protein
MHAASARSSDQKQVQFEQIDPLNCAQVDVQPRPVCEFIPS